MMRRAWLERNVWIWSFVLYIVLTAAVSIMSGSFSWNMQVSIATLASFLLLLTIGQMTVIATGGGAIDLSIQYTVALAAYLSSELSTRLGLVPGIGASLAACAFVGVINGLINMYLKVPPMITSLAVGYIVYSGVLMISSATTGMPVPAIAWFTQSARIGGVSPLVLVALFVALTAAFLLYRTKFGVRLHAVGQNRRAAALSGVSVASVVIAAFSISGVLAGIAGILLGGYFGGASQDMGLSYLLTSVAAAVIGGTNAAGGKSSVAGAIGGSLMLTMTVAFLNLSRLPMSAQNIIQGGLLMVILIASVPKGKVAR